MAKTARFDRQEVINKATNLYWRKGFHATSMRNLQDEIDLRPGSIYAAFGSKEALFKETLRNYTDMALSKIEALKGQYDSPTEALKALVKNFVIDSQTDAPNGVCMLAKTLCELTEDNQELIEITKNHLEEISNEFTALIQQAQMIGEIDGTKDAKELANYLQIQITGLRVFAKINCDKALLNSMIDNLFNHYPFS